MAWLMCGFDDYRAMAELDESDNLWDVGVINRSSRVIVQSDIVEVALLL
jgi:hypothetical protein